MEVWRLGAECQNVEARKEKGRMRMKVRVLPSAYCRVPTVFTPLSAAPAIVFSLPLSVLC